MKLYLLHPISVHFPITLLITALFFEGVHRIIHKEWLGKASTALLYLGTLGALTAAGLGLLAEDTVPHVPDAWEFLYNHKILGLVTAGLFLVLSAWKLFWGKFWPASMTPRVFLGVWILAIVILMVTAYFGGELVFQFGVGYHR